MPTTLCASCWLTTSKVLSTLTVTFALIANGVMAAPWSANALRSANLAGDADSRNSKKASSPVKFGVTGNRTFCTVVRSEGMGVAAPRSPPRPAGNPPSLPRVAACAAVTAACACASASCALASASVAAVGAGGAGANPTAPVAPALMAPLTPAFCGMRAKRPAPAVAVAFIHTASLPLRSRLATGAALVPMNCAPFKVTVCVPPLATGNVTCSPCLNVLVCPPTSTVTVVFRVTL